MTDDCLLCRAERVTEWHFEDDECWITDCMVCRTPMIVWRPHGLPDAEGERRMLARLERIARQRYPAGFWIDPERRRIPDHWHAHARPDGGFFDPASNLYGRYDRSASQVPEAARQAEAVDTSTGTSASAASSVRRAAPNRRATTPGADTSWYGTSLSERCDIFNDVRPPPTPRRGS